jgi:hypothetical protein
MLPESRLLICARCHVRLKGSGDPNDNATVFCPKCGESDTELMACWTAADYRLWAERWALHLGGQVLSEKAPARPVGGGGVVNGWGM